MHRVVGKNVHLGLRHLEVDLLAAQRKLVSLKFSTGKEALLGKLAAPIQLLRRALKLLVRKGNIGLALALLLGEVSLLVLLKRHFGEIERNLALQHIAFAFALRDLKTLLGNDEISVRGVRRYFLVVALFDEGCGVELNKQISGIDVDAVLNNPENRVPALKFAAENHLIAALHRTGRRYSDSERTFSNRKHRRRGVGFISAAEHPCRHRSKHKCRRRHPEPFLPDHIFAPQKD